MTLKQGFLLAVFLIVAVVVIILLFLQYLDMKEQQSAYQALVEEGLDLVNYPGEDNLDLAIRNGLSALEILPQGKEALLLLGRAYLLKKWPKKSVEELEKIINEVTDQEFHMEAYYHLGLAYFMLFNDIKQRDLWNKAYGVFSEAASIGFHRGDAYFNMAFMYLQSYKDNPTPDLKEKVVLNLKRCREREDGMEGYVSDEPDSPCPFCKMPFKKKSEEEIFEKLWTSLAEK